MLSLFYRISAETAEVHSFRPARIGWVCFLLMIAPHNLQANGGLASAVVASRGEVHHAGLTVEWTNQAGSGITGKIADWVLNVNENNATTYFVLAGGGTLEVISQHDFNSFGEPFGLDGAVEYMSVRKEILTAKLNNKGLENPEITIDQYTLPESRIYLLTGEGMVIALNADTGRTEWKMEIGSYRFPNIGIGASNQYIAAINGSSVYCLDSSNGKILWSRECKTAPAAGPAISENKIYVPLVDGRMQVFHIDESGLETFTLVALGSATAKPLLSDETVSWPTTAGHLNVATINDDREKSVRFRLKADRPIDSPPTFKDGVLYTGSLDGFVYAVEQSGSMRWEVSASDGITQSPIAIGDSVYVITIRNRMLRIDAATGEFLWPKPLPRISSYVGASRDRMYLKDQDEKLLVINSKTGAVLSRIDAGDIDLILPNQQTDRLYFANSNGLVQCLRETRSPYPIFHSDELAAMETIQTKPDKATGAAKKQPDDVEPKESVDPFNANNDPFATKPATPSTSAADDPFAAKPTTPGTADNDDPFAPKSTPSAPATRDPFAPMPSEPSTPSTPSAVPDDPFGFQ